MKYLTRLVIAFSLFFTTTANASLILNDDNSLDIGEFLINESFFDFYGYDTNVPDSSNTGFELTNTAVFLITNFNNQLALVGHFGSFVSEGDEEGGSLSLTFLNEGFGSLLFVDDKKDENAAITNGPETTITFTYIRNRNDGFIFGLGDGTNVDLNLSLDNIDGIDQFVLLNSGSNPYILGNNFSIKSVKVSEPSVLILMALATCLLLARRRIG